MKLLFEKITHVTKQFDVFDIGVLKILCIVFGALFAVYFTSFFRDIIWVLRIVFVVTLGYMFIKIFGFYWKEDKK